MRSLSLSLAQLQASFKKVEVAATVQCTGNRRAEMKAVAAPGGSTASVKGLDWDTGAIGTATWGGVRLRDVLLAAGAGACMLLGLLGCCASATTHAWRMHVHVLVRATGAPRAWHLCLSLTLTHTHTLSLCLCVFRFVLPSPALQACSLATLLSSTSTFTAWTLTRRACRMPPPSLQPRRWPRRATCCSRGR